MRWDIYRENGMIHVTVNGKTVAKFLNVNNAVRYVARHVIPATKGNANV